jgi:hypothetical protein
MTKQGECLYNNGLTSNTVTEFPNGIGSVVITPNLPNINRKVWHFINLRIQILNEILKERS